MAGINSRCALFTWYDNYDICTYGRMVVCSTKYLGYLAVHLALAKGWWHSVAGMVIVGLVLHSLCITDLMKYLPTGSAD